MKKEQNHFCPICGNNTCNDLNLHFYSMFKCNRCNHIFNDFPEKACEEYRIKYLNIIRNKENHFLQDIPTKHYKKWRQQIEDRKIKITQPFLSPSISLLDCNTEDGTFLSYVKDKVFSSHGICSDKIFNNISINNSFHICSFETFAEKIKPKKFDLIVMIDFLEHTYCLYETIIEAFCLLKTGGILLIDVPIENDPKKNYQARCHEFSRLSFIKFIENINPKSQVYYHKNYATAEIKQ